MRFRKKRDEEPAAGIAPLIDIVFLLLIFFMVTSHYDIASGVRINLPKVMKRSMESGTEERITLIIDRDARVYLDGTILDRDELRKRLKKSVEKMASLHLVIQADSEVNHGRVVEIMDMAKNVGIVSIIIAARWDSGELL